MLDKGLKNDYSKTIKRRRCEETQSTKHSQ